METANGDDAHVVPRSLYSLPVDMQYAKLLAPGVDERYIYGKQGQQMTPIPGTVRTPSVQKRRNVDPVEDGGSHPRHLRRRIDSQVSPSSSSSDITPLFVEQSGGDSETTKTPNQERVQDVVDHEDSGSTLVPLKPTILSEDTRWKACLSREDTGQVLKSIYFPLIVHFLSSSRAFGCASVGMPQPTLYIDGPLQGCMFVYDERTPNYWEDTIEWKKTKMSVKYIVYNAQKDSFKLKNHKTDVGVPVLRRQTWQGDGMYEGWRRHEYKVMAHSSEFVRPRVVPYPALIHYFTKENGTSPPRGSMHATPKPRFKRPLETVLENNTTPASMRPPQTAYGKRGKQKRPSLERWASRSESSGEWDPVDDWRCVEDQTVAKLLLQLRNA